MKMYVSPETFSALHGIRAKEDFMQTAELAEFYRIVLADHFHRGRTEGVTEAHLASIGTPFAPTIEVIVGDPPE